ncbi:AI-2E family transporter [Halostella salina]|uniref:AI-2E family transporter n=1 Tax=Halostella salina TaxID=1547897 RepID=UPI000EF83090|nr:AI-2E family transporter [Halostella salina]
MGTDGLQSDHARLGWLLFVSALAAVAAYVAYSFVGLLTLGVFGYYATRPICRRISAAVDSDGIAATLTVLTVLLPVIGLLLYIGVQLFNAVQGVTGGAGGPPVGGALDALPEQQREALLSAVRSPRQAVSDPQGTLLTVLQAGRTVVSAVAGGALLLGLALTLTHFLLSNDGELSDALVRLFGGRDTVVYAYAEAVDTDLSSVFFGNFLFVLAMSVIAGVAYWATNLLAPGGLAVPVVPALAVLTGFASLIPLVVGKVVYLPVVAYLAVQAFRGDGASLAFVGGVLVAYFLVLDILPQTFLQPYITGRKIDTTMLLFGYLLGPVLFGWYGFFLLPILFVLILEAVRVVLPELLHGEPLTSDVEMGDSVGASVAETSDAAGQNGTEAADASSENGGAASGDSPADGE